MDAPRGMNEQEADKQLKALFREVAGYQAPQGMEQRILQAVAAIPGAVPTIEKPLLPGWAWLITGLLTAATVALGLFTRPSPAPWSLKLLPEGLLDELFGSPWLAMALASVALLLALNTWLNGRLATHRVH